MTDPTTWNSWPLVVNSSNDLDAFPGHGPPGCQTVTGDGEDASKRRAACDECRQRKLKCSGDPTGCARCVKQNLICNYSQQKQMGRPRKRQKVSDITKDPVRTTPDAQIRPTLRENSPGAPDQAIRGKNRTTAPCSMVAAEYVKTHQAPPPTSCRTDNTYGQLHSKNSDSDVTPPNDSPPTPYLSYPTSMEAWPDYSTMTQLPQMVADNHETPAQSSGPASSTPFESLNALPAIPACPCLPNLYLTLSTLSTVSTFPVSSHTVESLKTATRTAHSVLYCAVCPQKFQTGMQNVMLLGTLLNVLADGWNRVRIAPAAELRRGFSNAQRSTTEPEPELTPQEALCWRLFAHVLVRANVFGDAVAPDPFTLPDGTLTTSSCPFNCPKGIPITLSLLVSAMERRQKTWHEMLATTGEFPPRMPNSDFLNVIDHMNIPDQLSLVLDGDRHLCINIVKSAAVIVSALDHPAPTCSDLGLEGHVHKDECQICDSALRRNYTGAIMPRRPTDALFDAGEKHSEEVAFF